MEPEASLPHSQVPATCPYSMYQSRSEAFCVNDSLHDTFLRWGVNTSPNPQTGGPPLVGCPRLFIQYIRRYPPYWRPFFHPQPKDAPCCGDRDPLITAVHIIWHGVWGHADKWEISKQLEGELRGLFRSFYPPFTIKIKKNYELNEDSCKLLTDSIRVYPEYVYELILLPLQRITIYSLNASMWIATAF
jgi:hypothetical protein